MKTLHSILNDNEKIFNFTTTVNYGVYSFIAENQNDIASSIEDTLHRMKDNDFTDDEISFHLGAYKPSPSEWEELEAEQEYFYIDLDYVIVGQIVEVWEDPHFCYKDCKYKADCPHAKGINYDVWGEGISCRESEDNYKAFKNGEDCLPW